jgi:single-strand DNA-binding protein
MADNMVTLVGALGTDPELRTTPSGADVVNFSIATNERTKNAEGKWVDGATSWFRVAAWGTLGRNAHASLHKGQRVVVQGVLRITEYSTASNGASKSADVRALALGHDLTFGTSTFTKGGPPAAVQTPAPQAPPVQAPQSTLEDADDTRVPQIAGGGWAAPLSAGDETPF